MRYHYHNLGNTARAGYRLTGRDGGFLAGLLATALILASCASTGRGAQAAIADFGAHPIANPQPKAVRGAVYHELLAVYPDEHSDYVAVVYNDIGFPALSAEQFAAIDTQRARNEAGALAVVKNGPRLWVLDEIMAYEAGSPARLAGYDWNRPAYIRLSREELARREPCRATRVERKTQYRYQAGKPMYFLTAPDGTRYVMQSASREVDPRLDLAALDTLAERLALPEGWSYHRELAETDQVFEISGTAWVLQDNFMNSYQRVAP